MCSGWGPRITGSPVAELPVLVAALGPVMLRIAGELTDGTALWMADEHVVPAITKSAEAAGRSAPRVVAGIPVCLCAAGDEEAIAARFGRFADAGVTDLSVRLLFSGG
ncbi:LLM class flavin-dependent oxidoreductase [Streptomyces acidiscabies]|uniref:LLM class flavin-dependent oxidoreductase n=1 Tax=Streptomyces acidiscabies TaxID=42234 RepID=UPI0038F7E68E